MGYQNENAIVTNRPWLVFDIETAPMPDCGDYLTDPIDAPSNYKDPLKIAAYCEEKRQSQIADAGLDVDLCEVVAISFQMEFGTQPAVYTRRDVDERGLLENFWYAVTQPFGETERRLLVGYNVLHFDLPVLMRRSLYLGVTFPPLQIDKYRHDGIVDVADILTYGGKTKWRSLAFYAKRFGIPHDDSIKGEQIAALVAAGQWEAVAEHCRADVQTTRALAERIGVIQAVREREEVAL